MTSLWRVVLLSVVGLISVSDVRATRAAEPGFKSLFNGKDLAGWDGDPRFWAVKDGLLTGRTTATNPLNTNTFLIWREGQLDDFELRLSYRITVGNSGVQYRSKDLGQWVVGGYQADFEAGNDFTGILFEERGRGILAQRGQKVVIDSSGQKNVVGSVGDPKKIQAGIKNENWNDYTIIARGNHLVHKINGLVTVDVTDEQADKAATTGILALQLSGGPPMSVQFKNIQLKRLPLDGAKKTVDAARSSPTSAQHEVTPKRGSNMVQKAPNKPDLKRPNPAASADLRELLQQACKQHGLPALGAAVVIDGQLAACDVAGVRKLGTQTPASINDLFHIGSCAKAVTATVIGILVEQGNLRWDATLEQIFPELKSSMHDGYRGATLEQILAHRAGMPTNPPGMSPVTMHELPGNDLTQKRLTFLKLVLAQAPVSKPGQRFEYSNVGYTVAGAIAERVTKKPWERLVQDLLFKPLDMRQSSFGASQLWGHVSLGSPPQPVPPGPNPNDPPAMSPAGSVVHCSMADLAKFAALHMDADAGQRRLLKPETVARLHQPLDANDGYAAGWGLTGTEWSNGPALVHAGANPMNYCVIWLAPQRKCALIVATNMGPPQAQKACDDVIARLVNQFLQGGAGPGQRP
jgi:CubicO group peptidase (beta-lactamase class C family)